ncbi:hypothetical protein D3C87_1365380 [compost metagenome]
MVRKSFQIASSAGWMPWSSEFLVLLLFPSWPVLPSPSVGSPSVRKYETFWAPASLPVAEKPLIACARAAS